MILYKNIIENLNRGKKHFLWQKKLRRLVRVKQNINYIYKQYTFGEKSVIKY